MEHKQRQWQWIQQNEPNLASFLLDVNQHFGKPKEVKFTMIEFLKDKTTAFRRGYCEYSNVYKPRMPSYYSPKEQAEYLQGWNARQGRMKDNKKPAKEIA